MSLRVLAKQGVSYGVVGVLALLVDWSCFVALTWCGVATVLANLRLKLHPLWFIAAGAALGLAGLV